MRRIAGVEDFRSIFDDGDQHEVVVANGMLRSRRVITRLEESMDSDRERYSVWSLVDDSEEECSLQDLLLDADSPLGKALKNGALFLDD